MVANDLRVHLILKSSLSLLNDSSETSRVADSYLGKHLSVQVDACLVNAVHEAGVVDAVHLACSGDSCDPESSEISLLLLSADVSILTALHNSLLSHLKMLALRTEVALSELQCLISSLYRTFAKRM